VKEINLTHINSDSIQRGKRLGFEVKTYYLYKINTISPTVSYNCPQILCNAFDI